MKALTVTQSFASYAVGDTITDRDAMKQARETNPASVVAVTLPDPDKAPPKSADGKAGA